MAPSHQRETTFQSQLFRVGPTAARTTTNCDQSQVDSATNGSTLGTPTEVDSPSAGAAVKKRGRGIAKGFEVVKRTKEGSKIDGLLISEEHFRPVGPSEKIFKMELGIITRLLAPLRTFYWKKMTAEMKEPLFARLQSEFQISLSNPHTREVVERAMANHFRQFKSRCHKHYKKFSNAEEARQNPPTDVEAADWIPLCDHFATEKFQRASKANIENRQKIEVNHTSGSKSFCQRMYELEKAQEDPQDGPTKPKEIKVYHDVHRKKADGTWIHPQAQQNYEQMESLHAGSTENEVQLGGGEILEKVLKPTRSAWGIAYGVRSHTRTRSTTHFHAESERESLLEKRIQDQHAMIEEQRAMLEGLQSTIDNLVTRIEARTSSPSNS